MDDPAREIAASGLFVAAWYLATNADIAAAGVDPLDHFARFGMAEGRAPNPWLDPGWYVATHAVTGVPALLHYLRHGDAAGLRPSAHFDPAWYRRVQGLPPDIPALRHLLDARPTPLPCPELFAVRFLDGYRDDPGDPYARWLADRAAAGQEADPHPEIVVASGLVDANFYLVNASDVLAAGMDAAQHYARYGWRESRRPNLYFDPAWYAATNPEVERLGVPPLLHYIVAGEPAGRRPVPWFDPAWYRTAHDVPAGSGALAHYLAHRLGGGVSPNPWFDAGWYSLQQGLSGARDPFAHYLHEGLARDLDPSPRFDAAAYRRRHLGRPSRAFRTRMRLERDHPLVHFLLRDYR